MPTRLRRLSAAALLAEILPGRFHPLKLFTRDPQLRRIIQSGRSALYAPGRSDRTGIVIVHGANPGGIEDPRMTAVVEAFARLGHPVLAPSLALGGEGIDRADLGAVRTAIEHLSDETARPVRVLAFSWGAAYALVALGDDPEIQSRVEKLATVGTFFDAVHLFQGVTCGRILYDGSEELWAAAPDAAERVTGFLARVLPAEEADPLVRAVKERKPDGLGTGAMAIYDLMTNQDPSTTAELMARLPGGLTELFWEMSPARVISQIGVPIEALHSTNDPAAPPGQSRALIKASVNPLSNLTVVSLFRHVTPTTGVRVWLIDGLRLVNYVARLL